jgi:ABC-type amino acid transport substrate-binding protein
MKKLITAVLFLICLGLAEQGIAQSTSYVGAQTQEKKEEKKKNEIKFECGSHSFPMKIASLSTNPPFGWVDTVKATKLSDPVNVGQGFGVDLIKKVANDLTIAVRPIGFNSYQETLKALNNGSIDLFIGAYYDTRFIRTGNVFVTPSFFKNIIQVVFPAGKEKPVEKFEDLIGLKGVVRTDEEFYPLIYRGLPKELNIRQVSSSQEAFTLLMTGEVDYLLGSPYSAEAEARRFKIENDIVYNEKPLADLEMFLVFSGNSKCLPLRQKIVDQLRIETKDPFSVRNKLVDQINAWGQRFADDKGLLETETNPTTPSPATQAQRK